jgi:methionyl-tRNA synthetase
MADLIPNPGSMVHAIMIQEPLMIFVEKVQLLVADRRAVERTVAITGNLCEDDDAILAEKIGNLDFAAEAIACTLGAKCPNCRRTLNQQCYEQSRCIHCKATLAFVPTKVD